MNIFEMFILSIGLASDSFAVAVTIGVGMKRITIKKALIVGCYFGLFQAGMPLIGYMAAIQFTEHVTQYSHWVVFVLLSFLGCKMAWGSFKKNKCTDRECTGTICTDRDCPKEGHNDASLKPAKMISLSIATSIDAMAVGVSFAFLYVRIAPAISMIGAVTLIACMIGVKIGNIFGLKYKSKAEFAGGIILILTGLWILLEHFFV